MGVQQHQRAKQFQPLFASTLRQLSQNSATTQQESTSMTIESSLKTIMKGKGYLAILLIAVVAGILIFSTGRFPTGLQTGQTSTQPFTVLLSSNPGETSIPINWNSYSGTGFYRVQIKPSNSTSWTNVADVTTTSHTIASVPIVKKGNTYDTRVLA